MRVQEKAVLLAGKHIKLIPDWVLHRSPWRQMHLSPWQGVAQMDCSHWTPGGCWRDCGSALQTKTPLCPQKALIEEGDNLATATAAATSLSRCHSSRVCSLSSCWIAVISCTLCRLCGSRGDAKVLRFSTKISPLHLCTNTLTGFQSHCQSLNLCLSVAECLSECE